VTLITQTKGQVTGAHQLEDQEKERCIECLRQAKAAVPQHENTLQLEAEVLALDEKLDEAIEVVESLVRRSDEGDGVPLVIKANYLAQKVSLTYRLELLPKYCGQTRFLPLSNSFLYRFSPD